MSRFWDRYWFGPVAAARPYLLARGLYLALAFDCWNSVPRAARYSPGGFNVAHFAWLDVLSPAPGPATYLAVILAAGLLSFVLGCLGPRRVPGLLLAGLYTFGWAMSMLDSYQHHYLLSIMLVLVALFPALSVDELEARAPELSKAKKKKAAPPAPSRPAALSSWPYALLLFNTAVVYGYTAISKSEADWRSGETLRALASARERLEPIAERLASVGIAAPTFWLLMGLGTVAIQVAVSAGYLLGPRRDSLESRPARLAALAALAAALSFHFGAELLRLRIGIFSWYMIGLALVAFLPAGPLGSVARLLAAPARALGRRFAEVGRGTALTLAAAAALVLAGAGLLVDLPGALVAGGAAAVATLAAASWLALRGRPREGARAALAAGLAGLCMLAWIAGGTLRGRFYHRLAQEQRQAGDVEGAAEADGKLEKYGTPELILDVGEP